MSDLFGGTTLAAQVAEVERELAMRRQVYPRRVAEKRMTQAAADRHIEVMEAVAESLHRLGGLESPCGSSALQGKGDLNV
jgi:hypothetical protein